MSRSINIKNTNMTPLMAWLSDAMNWLTTTMSNAYGALSAFFISIIGYFLPIKNMVHLVLLFFLVDMIVGYIAARKLRGEEFNGAIVWSKTIPRAGFSVFFILATYMTDQVFGQDYICLYKLVGWFLCSIVLISISKNAYKLTGWMPFKYIGTITKKEVSKKTEITEEEIDKA